MLSFVGVLNTHSFWKIIDHSCIRRISTTRVFTTQKEDQQYDTNRKSNEDSTTSVLRNSFEIQFAFVIIYPFDIQVVTPTLNVLGS